jgi:DNA-binding transcriptional LysR family regulator
MSYQLETRHLRYFLAVASELNFRKAAEQLYISQPGLSRQIKEMEEGLGIKLFERTNRKVALTKAGEYLRTELSRHFKSLENSIHHAKLLNDGIRGELKLGYVGSAMQEIIPSLLIAFKEKHPNILFDLTEMDNQHQIEGLMSGDLDIGFVRLIRIPRGLASQQILIEPFCLVLPKDHPINSSNFKGLSQLRNESFILFDPNYSPSYYETVMQIFDDSGFAPIVSHRTIHSSSIYKLVENDFGISIVPKSLLMTNSSGVKFIELTKIPQRTTLSVVWNAEYKNMLIGDFLKEFDQKN